MKKSEFKKLIRKKIIVLDGATGTELQKRGMPSGVSPEKWVLDNPNIFIQLQKEYADAGSDIVYSCTFGCNYFKLKDYGLENDVLTLNKQLVKISRKAVGKKCFIAGDISSTGKMIKPFGDTDFELIVEKYKEQVKGLLAGGIDLFVIETIMDIQEARAALLAVKESCDLPVMVSMTYEKNGRTLNGTDPVTALITLQSLGADAVGANCSTGPEDMLLVVASMKHYAKVPIFAKPNAGMPELVGNQSVFKMTPKQFSQYIPDFIGSGINLIGGCCGTSPEFIQSGVNMIGGCCGTSPKTIKKIKSKSKIIKPVKPLLQSVSALSSPRKSVLLDFEQPITIVGERINPTGKKILQEELRNGQLNEVRKFAKEQEEQGAKILDVNVGMPGIDEKSMLITITEFLTRVTDIPLCFDSSNIEALEAALRIYPGRALINSISAEKHKLKKLLPIAAKYGAMFILLPLDDRNVPETAKERISIIKQIYNEAKKNNYTKEDFIVDGLVMTVSSNQQAAVETLNVIEWCKEQFKVKTIVGLSNVSFGLPERETINSTFLALAVSKGLTMAIANPSHVSLMSTKIAVDLLLGRDKDSKNYIQYFSKKVKAAVTQEQKIEKSITELIYNAVVEGDKDNIVRYVKQALESGIVADDIVNKNLIPAIQKVGELFDKKEYFLPQLILSAETMKLAFDFLTPYLTQEGKQLQNKRIILATVKGDIHDIGKNIVGLMLKNYGFQVIDLGKNIDAETIVNKALKSQADIIGLSALMTTTMTEMKHVIDLAQKKGVKAQFMVGGAVVTNTYAKEIGANYAKDAIEAVRLCEK